MIDTSAMARSTERAFAFLVFAALILYTFLAVFKQPWSGDFDLYLAAVSSLYADFGSPAHETLPIPGGYSHLFSPYIVGVAGLGRVLGLGDYEILQFAGLANLLFYAGAVVLFFRSFSLFERSWYPPTMFLIVSTLLYNNYYHWSSELHLRTVVSTVAYPSFLAWALALAGFAWANDFLKDGGAWKLIAVVVVTWLALLTHPLTASWMILTLGLLGLLSLATKPRDRVRTSVLAGSILAGAAATYLWPYTNLADLVVNATAITEAPPFLNEPFKARLWLYVLAAPCFAYLVWVRRHAFLLLGFVGTFLAYLMLTRVLQVDFFARYIFFQAFFAQVAVAELASMGPVVYSQSRSGAGSGGPSAWLARAKAYAFPAGVISLAILAPGTREAFARGHLEPPWELVHAQRASDVYSERFAELRQLLKRGDVLVAPWDSPDESIAAVTGARLVASPHALGAPDYRERMRDARSFFSPYATRAERHRLIEKYHVTWVLLWYPDPETLSIFEDQFGSPILVTDDFWLFAASHDVRRQPSGPESGETR